jgi:rubrerythrin
MARTLDEAVRKLRKVRCSSCGREFLSNSKAPHVCPACKKKARALKAVKKLARKG